MAGSDPKTNRALEQTSARNDIDAEEDPLVELARIVSEDGAFGMAKPEKPKPTRPAPMSRPSLEDGLEAELLQELESSFAVREPPAPPAPRPTTVRSNPAPAPSRAPVAPARPANAGPDPDELLRSIEEQLGQFERRHGGRFGAAPSNVSEPPAAEETAPDWDEPVEERPGPTFGAPSAESRRGSRIRPFAESTEPSDVAPEPAPFEELPSLSAARSDYRFRGPASANWDPAPREDYASEAIRDAFEDAEPSPSAAADTDDLFTQADAEAALARAEAAVARGRVEEERSPEAHRRDRIAATFPEFEEEPPVTMRPQPDLAGLEAGLSRELEPEYSDASPADKWRDSDAPAEESRVAAAIAPGPSRRAAAARAAADRGRSRMGLLTAAGVILVVLIGAGTALYLRSSEEGGASSPPPVIAADEGAVRVEPTQDQAATDGETVGDAVYNRVAGASPETEEQMVESAEEPKEVARIVLPPSQTPDEQAAISEDAAGGPPATAESALTDAAAATDDEIGPRRVPTFVVRADGSIVETNAASPAANPAAAQNQQLASETVPIEPTPVPTVAIAEAPAEGEGLPRPTPPAETEAPAAAVDMTPRPSIDEQPAEVAAAESEIDLAPPPTAAEATASGEPGTLANAAPEAATPDPAEATSGSYLVQLSAQRSMDQAQSAYEAAQGQFPSVLGSLSPQIQEANLGEKGIYFRVRVGPWASRDEAIGVCESLKAAGGSCFVTQ